MLTSLYSLFYVTGKCYRFLHRGRAQVYDNNVTVKSKLQHPPPPLPWTYEFFEKFCSNPPFLGQKAVQIPHHMSIPGDQIPPLKLPDHCFNFSIASFENLINPFTPKGDLIDFTPSNARRFYSI